MPEERVDHAKDGEVGKLGKLGGHQREAIFCRRKRTRHGGLRKVKCPQ
jgi:hypothetical protein